MDPPTAPLTIQRECAERIAAFRILPPKPVSAHAAHRGQKRLAFRVLFPRGTFAEMGDGGVEGTNSVYYKFAAADTHFVHAYELTGRAFRCGCVG